MIKGRHESTEPGQVAVPRRMALTAVTCMAVSIALMVMLGLEGPSAGGRAMFAPSPPWPPWFFHAHQSIALWSITLWLAELLGGGGLILALIAVRQGWRPPLRRLILGSVVAVVALVVVPPADNGDPLYYAAYGRIAELGHSPYVMKPVQQMPAADPIRAAVPFYQQDPPSRYGPVATGTQAAASGLAGDSTARTIFWLKMWNALAYLGLVLALDRAVRSDAARRVRAHLLWSVNPLMLFAVLANGHNDVLAAVAGACALLVIKRVDSLRGLLAGVLLGLATAIRVPYSLFGAGLAWAVRRSPRALAALILGAAAVLVPSYMLFGPAAIKATTTGLASGERPDLLWHDAAGLLGWQHAMALTNILGVFAGAVLAAILLWRMPPGPRDFPAVRIALALSLGLLVAAPLQVPSYDAMIFPLLAVFPVTRLDWIIVARNAAMTAAAAPFIVRFDPEWLTAIERVSTLGTPVVAVVAVDVALLWLCFTRAWTPTTGRRVAAVRAGVGTARSPAG